MRKAFTITELMIVVAIIVIVLAIAIPSLIESTQYRTSDGKIIKYRDLVGKTFIWNGNKVIVSKYGGNYDIVIFSKNGNAVSVSADDKIIMEAYLEYINKPINAEKIEQ